MDTGWKFFQKPAAAERLTAKPQAAQHLALIAHADLAQLDAGVELGRRSLTSSRKSTRLSAVK